MAKTELAAAKEAAVDNDTAADNWYVVGTILEL